MIIPTDTGLHAQETLEQEVCFVGEHFQVFAPQPRKSVDTPRYLVTMDVGIGDAVAVGLSAVEQIVSNDPGASGKIDVLCNPLQSEIFRYDPRVNRIIETSLVFFPSTWFLTWYNLFKPERRARPLLRFLRHRHYEAIFPSIVAPSLYFGLGAHIMYPDLWKLARDIFIEGKREDKPLRKLVRQMVNRYFGRKVAESELADEPTLYLSAEEMEKASFLVERMRAWSGEALGACRILVVASDSASVVTRPPTSLLAPAIAGALERCPDLVACILPGYTDTQAAVRLEQALARDFAERVFTLLAEPRLPLLETAALIDRADVLVTGDTGIMHLGVARKRLRPGDDRQFAPGNGVKIIALFGGTNPGFYGYPQRTLIIGRGRKEQRAFRPGFSKEAYDPKGRDLFDHIAPAQVSEAILSQL